jgi:hypothetical protein
MPAIKPVLTEGILGDRAFSAILRLAQQRARHPRDQVASMVLFAADRYFAGEDIELSQERLEALFDEAAEGVA